MLLTPRYGDNPIISVEVRSEGPHPLVGQRRRLEAFVRGLSEEEWQHPTRCDGWSVQDVITHLTSTNGFWALSIQAGLAGEPTRYLGAFDPVASPAELVDQAQGTSPDDTLHQFESSNAGLADVVSALDEAGWATLAEAPPGHLPIRLVADHALWDSWVHERDIVLPLGRPPVVEADEVLACLRYGAALGRAFALCGGSTEQGAVTIEVDDPTDRLVVAVGADVVRVHAGPAPDGAPSLRADAVELVEMLSRRDTGGPVPPEVDWLTAGLADVFDQSAPA